MPTRTAALRRRPAGTTLRRLVLTLLCLALLAPLPGWGDAARADTPAKTLFGARGAASDGPAQPIGSYARGCIGGAVRLPETGPAWQAMRLSRNRNWGHPDTIAFVARLGAVAQGLGWAGIYVGDISQPRGGPMTSGHASHQIGLDADIWMLPPERIDLSVAERESLSSISVRGADRVSLNGNWSPEHAALMRAAASDPAVERIFVTAPVKAALCHGATPEDTPWLRKIRPWWGHHYHFHVRLACPDGAGACRDQDPIPPGSGCDETLAWWSSDEALNPQPTTPAAPRAALTLADLPAACGAVLAAP